MPERRHDGRCLRAARTTMMWGAAMVFMVGSGLRSAVADTSFLKIEALTVDATDPNHDGWVNLVAFGDGSVRGPQLPPALGGAKASPPRFTDLTVLKAVDKSSPALMQACATGKHFAKAQIDFVRPDPSGDPTGGVTYLTITMTDLLVSSYSFSSGPDSVPMESISLNFKTYALDYTDRAATGSCRITYDVLTADSSFSRGPPQNHPPTLAAVPTQVGQAGQLMGVSVGIGDLESPVGSLTLVASADNPALLPAGSVTTTGTGATRSVQLAPSPGVPGMAHVTLSASDGLATTSTTFLAVFTPQPGPSIVLTNAVVPEHTPAGTSIGQLLVDPSLPGGPPGLSLLDSAAGRFRIEENRLIVNDPVLLDFESAPRPAVVVGYADPAGGPTAYARFIIQVENVPEGPFDDWRDHAFMKEQLLDPAIAGPEADPDRDGLKNLIEYALSLPPQDGGDPGTTPRLGEVEIGDETFLTLTYQRRPPSFDPDLSITPLISTDLRTWDCGPSHFVLVSEKLISADLMTLTVRSVMPKRDGVRQYVRLQVVR